ncbi:hypothetical protein F3D3_4211 [Fusibacter sp. 3D3]|nr:hypothetical protein F3D3_4211 [Fusibacter sp. 3D3]
MIFIFETVLTLFEHSFDASNRFSLTIFPIEVSEKNPFQVLLSKKKCLCNKAKATTIFKSGFVI